RPYQAKAARWEQYD
ncbi:hypothetical protein D046_3193B, partial [Vibrio parahaemolyticus V-223/04]